MKLYRGQKTVVSIFSLRPTKIGGVEAYARELSRQLDESGWKSVLCFRSPPSAEVRSYLSLPNVTLETFEKPFSFWLIPLLYRHRPAILHLTLFEMFGPYAWLARFLGVSGIYVTDQLSRPEDLRLSISPLWKRLCYRIFMAPLKKVICASCYVYDNLLGKQLFAREQLLVVYNAVDIAAVDRGMPLRGVFRATYNVPDDAFLVVQVGQIIPEKGVADLLSAARQVLAVNAGVYFLFAGDGRSLPGYRQLVHDWGLTGRIIFAGQLADPMGEGVYAAADMLCAVSRWEEAFGLVIAEGMAAAKPLLGTRVGAIPELVQDSITGFIVDRGDSAAMAARILQLAADPELCAGLGKAGRKVCEEKFELEQNVKQLLELYELR